MRGPCFRRCPINSSRALVLTAVAIAGLGYAGQAMAYRPFEATDADVADSRTIEIEFGPAEFIAHGPDHALQAPTLTVNFGLGGGYEFGVEGVNLVALKPEEGVPRMQLVDTGLALKHLLKRGGLQDAHGSSIAAEAVVLFPGRGQDHLGAEAGGIISNDSKTYVSHLELGVSRSPEGSNGAGAGLILETADHRGWRPVAELNLEGAQGEPPSKSVLIGSIYEAREGFSVDAGVRLGQSDGVRWTEVRAGFAYQIGPRGTAPLRHFAKFHLRRRRH